MRSRYAGLVTTRAFLFVLGAAVCLSALSQELLSQEPSNPWPKSDILEPAILAQAIRSPKSPIVISVAFPVLYRSKHILHAIEAGPGSKREGLEALKKAVAEYPKDADLVIYCGCCPMIKCPNVRPAYSLLKELGFTRVRVLKIPTNMHDDWYTKNYPSENGS